MVALVGGGTGLIGDPSGKQSERPLMDARTLSSNVQAISQQLGRYVGFSDSHRGVLLNNADWLCSINLLDFLRDTGKHFSVGSLLSRDSVSSRLSREQGLSFTEFSYTLLQAYDFLAAYDLESCTLQCGGSDQWGNIVSGIDLVRRMRSVDVHGMTSPLVMKSDGTKFGKTENGTVWLDPNLTSPYDFYQFWIRTEDSDLERRLLEFTFLTLEEIKEVMALGPSKARTMLADSVTYFVHGEDTTNRVRETSGILFSGGDLSSLTAEDLDVSLKSAPTTTYESIQERDLISVLVTVGLYPSRGQARSGLQQSAVRVNNQVVGFDYVLRSEDVLPGGYVILRRGSKTYHVLKITE